MKNEVEYDLSLGQFLIDNGFGTGSLMPLTGPGSWAYSATMVEVEQTSVVKSVPDTIREIKEKHQNGCIFTLPAAPFFPDDLMRANWVVVVYTPFSSSEIRKRVANKAFL